MCPYRAPSLATQPQPEGLPGVSSLVRVILRNALLCALIVLALAPASASASPTQWTSFEAPSELLDDSRRDITLDEIRDFGVTRVRAIVYWRNFAPKPNSRRRPKFDASDPEAYPHGTWDRLDALFQAATARRISVQLTPTGPVPKWATRQRRDQYSEPSPREFQAWVTALGRRYGTRTAVWSIWNEPNHPDFLRPQRRQGNPASPTLYRNLYLAGLRGLRASGNRSDLTLFGETAPRGGQTVDPIPFIKGALCLNDNFRRVRRCGRLRMDGYAHHAYTTSAGPLFQPPNADEVTFGVIDRIPAALDRSARTGAVRSGVDLYLTEFGIQSYPDRISGVPLAKQAENLAIAERIAYANPRVRSFSQYLMRDDKPRKGTAAQRYGGFETGLRFHDGRKKPAYDGFRLPLAAADYGSSDVLWGRVRPFARRTRVLIQVSSRRGWRNLRTVDTNAIGVFGSRARHRKGQRYRVQWTSPEGKVFRGPPIRPYKRR